MKPAPHLISWTLLAVALSAVTAFLVVRFASPPAVHHHGNAGGHDPHGPDDSFHAWLHERLAITPEQESKLAPIENAYERNRALIASRISEGGRNLAEALGKGPVDRTAVDLALGDIHAAQGDLQRLTIGHFLEMKEHLTEEQAGQLLQWTRESITHDH